MPNFKRIGGGPWKPSVDLTWNDPEAKDGTMGSDTLSHKGIDIQDEFKGHITLFTFPGRSNEVCHCHGPSPLIIFKIDTSHESQQEWLKLQLACGITFNSNTRLVYYFKHACFKTTHKSVGVG